MKKKLYIAIATGVFMIAMMVNLSVAQKGNAGNLTIGSLVKISTANAEVTICATYYGGIGVCCFVGGSGCATGWGEWDGPYYNY